MGPSEQVAVAGILVSNIVAGAALWLTLAERRSAPRNAIHSKQVEVAERALCILAKDLAFLMSDVSKSETAANRVARIQSWAELNAVGGAFLSEEAFMALADAIDAHMHIERSLPQTVQHAVEALLRFTNVVGKEIGVPKAIDSLKRIGAVDSSPLQMP